MNTLAQIINPVIPSTLGSGGNPAGPPAVGSYVSGVIGMLFLVAFVFAFINLLLGGYDWITSGGDKTKLQSARDRITNAIVGLIITGAAWAVMTLVGQFLGIGFPDMPIPSIGG